MTTFMVWDIISDAERAAIAPHLPRDLAQAPMPSPYAGYRPPMDDDATRRWHALMTARPVGARRRVA